MGQQQDPKSFGGNSSPPDIINMCFMAGRVTSMWVFPFTHRGMGVHAMAWSGPLALLSMICFLAAMRSDFMVFYIPFWLLAVIVRRLRPDRNQPSQYVGTPWLAKKLPFVRREYTAQIIETLGILALGFALKGTSRNVSMFFLISGTGMLCFYAISRMTYSMRLTRMRDAAIQQQHLAEDLRQMRW